MRIGSIFGFPVRLHWSFLVMFAVGAIWVTLQLGAEQLPLMVGAFFTLFAMVLMHELAHSLVARRYGVTTENIWLLPIGGAAMMRPTRVTPWQDVWISVAGPASNLLLAAVLWVVNLWFPSGPLQVLVAVNVGLGLFNLIPCYPMDGGRVLRALLVQWLSMQEATAIVLGVGFLLALAMGLIGLLLTAPGLLVVAVFILFTQINEWRRLGALSSVPGVTRL